MGMKSGANTVSYICFRLPGQKLKLCLCSAMAMRSGRGARKYAKSYSETSPALGLPCLAQPARKRRHKTTDHATQ